MSIFKTIKNFLSQSKEEEKVPEGLCPNCWGRQEYQGKFYETIKNDKVDINNLNEHKGWVDKYFQDNLSKIQLIKDDEKNLSCKKCKLTFKEL